MSKFCVECGDQTADCHCVECDDQYCEVCYQALHRRGARFRHVAKPLVEKQTQFEPDLERPDVLMALGNDEMKTSAGAADKPPAEADVEVSDDWFQFPLPQRPEPEWFVERCRYIPMRLDEEERRLLALLEAAMDVSEYTDNIDIWSMRTDKRNRVYTEIMEICATLSGLRVASDFNSGKNIVLGQTYKGTEELYRRVMEVGRRHKIRNPDRMRTQYGKLIHMLQDSHSTDLELIAPLLTVQRFLKMRRGGSKLLAHPLLAIATAEVRTGPDVPRAQVDRAVVAKRNALDTICKDCATDVAASSSSSSNPSSSSSSSAPSASDAVVAAARAALSDGEGEGEGEGEGGAAGAPVVDDSNDLTLAPLTVADIQRCVASIFDNHSFLLSNRGPVDVLIDELKANFEEPSDDPALSLRLQYGVGGSCLGHDHATQYTFVSQSLILWRNILHDMFRLWSLSEMDLLDPERGYFLSVWSAASLPHRLVHTGQGLNRMQQCPKISAAMSKLVGGTHRQTRARFGGWVGLSVVHLGDRDVPNALIFIDKYNQVSRILTPIVATLRDLPRIYQADKAVREVVDDKWGSCEKARLAILADFFKHGFDGSGDDGGSCIDGRLTSCWNWCSKIAKKDYYILFLLTGFVGFDGEF